MKTLKQILLPALLFLSVSIQTSAQHLSLGAKGGFTISDLNGSLINELPTENKIGYNLGLTLNYSLSSNIELLSGLDLSMKGTKVSIKENEVDDLKFDALYLQLPVHLGYKLPIAGKYSLIFHGGPFIASGIGGKVHELSIAELNNDPDIENPGFFSGYFAKRFDYGLGIGVNAETPTRIFVGIGYDWGLKNISRNEASGKVRTRNFFLSIGYKIRK